MHLVIDAEEIIEQIRPPAGVPLIEGATLSELLGRLAGMMLRAALSPPGIALHRTILAESARFPELPRPAGRRQNAGPRSGR